MIDRLEILSNGFIKDQFFGSNKDLIKDSWIQSEIKKLFDETDFNFERKSEGFLYDECYKLNFFGYPFLLFTGKHYKTMPDLKLIINPNIFPCKVLREMLEIYFEEFFPARVGRIDFNIDFDLPIFSFVNAILLKKKRKSITQRDFFKKELETIYIGSGSFMIRIYNKLLEARQKKNEIFLKEIEKHKFENITRLEFQLRGRSINLELSNFLNGDFSLDFLNDLSFFIKPNFKGSFRDWGIQQYYLNFGLQATYLKMERNFRKEWLKEKLKEIDIKNNIEVILKKEISDWLIDRYKYKIHKISF